MGRRLVERGFHPSRKRSVPSCILCMPWDTMELETNDIRIKEACRVGFCKVTPVVRQPWREEGGR